MRTCRSYEDAKKSSSKKEVALEAIAAETVGANARKAATEAHKAALKFEKEALQREVSACVSE